MKRMHVIGLAAVAALLVTAMGASAAFGFSEWLAAGGANPNGITITGKGGAARFESRGGTVIKCDESASTGTFKGTTDASTVVEYKKNCKISGVLNGACNEPIKTEQLIALPGTIATAKNGRGVLLSPAAGEVMAKLTC